MGKSNELVARWMEFSIENIAWVDPFLYFECSTSDDTPLLNVLGWKVVREFSNWIYQI